MQTQTHTHAHNKKNRYKTISQVTSNIVSVVDSPLLITFAPSLSLNLKFVYRTKIKYTVTSLTNSGKSKGNLIVLIAKNVL